MIINTINFLENTISKFSKKTAIEDNNGTISFLDLKEEAIKIASKINLLCKIANQPIGVFLPKSKESVISFLGVNYSGNFYVPLDIKSPKSRLNKIIEKLSPKLIITNLEGEKILDTINYLGIIVILDKTKMLLVPEGEKEIIINSIGNKIDTDPVYSIFTSGSTGTPKGVLVSHRGVIDYIEWAIETYNVTEKEIIGSQAPFYFDNSTLDIYLMLATGAKLIIVPEDKYMFPLRLIDYLKEKQINFVFWVPSVLVSVANFNALETALPTTLKKILFAGEVMSNKHLNYWRKYFPDALYSNLYGPTEITVDCTYYIVDREFKDEEPLPIGKPCRNSGVLILNKNNQLVAGDEIGELCVRGSSLAFGYYKDPEKTALAFVQNPLNDSYPEIIYRTGDLVQYNNRNEILFLGRKDSQIKHLGYRIELGEIESAFYRYIDLDEAAVVYANHNNVSKIIGFFVSKKQVPIIQIKEHLQKHLPLYMVPQFLFQIEEIPKNPAGKINRVLLSNETFINDIK